MTLVFRLNTKALIKQTGRMTFAVMFLGVNKRVLSLFHMAKTNFLIKWIYSNLTKTKRNYFKIQ